MNKYRLKLIVIVAAVAGAGFSSIATAETCSNSCVTMAIPRSAEGVQTRLDGSADAALWPPGQDLRTIWISALNDHGSSCNVTIHDVRQDEAPGVAGSGAPVDDAVNCSNEGTVSSVDLRSERASNGDGRSYHIRFSLDDPDCSVSAKADEVLVVVPRDETVTSLQPDTEDESTLTASYSGDTLQCSPKRDDRLARAATRR